MNIGGLEIPVLPNIPRANWSIGSRGAQPARYFTAHYNGPKVASFGYVKGEQDQIRSDARYQMQPGALGAKSGGDGIQYHGGTFSDGSSYLFRDIRDILWHCRNYEGNNWSISWHMPLGEGQTPTAPQIRGFYAVIDAFRLLYPTIAVNNVRGHREWSTTLCPGAIMPYVIEYREQRSHGKAIQWFKTKYNANVRTAPDVRSPIALGGKAVTPANTTFAVDAIVSGVPYSPTGKVADLDDQYVHRADGLGFYHISVVTSL